MNWLRDKRDNLVNLDALYRIYKSYDFVKESWIVRGEVATTGNVITLREMKTEEEAKDFIDEIIKCF
jgi:phage terminase large subunit